MKLPLIQVFKWGTFVFAICAGAVTLNIAVLAPYPVGIERVEWVAVAGLICAGSFYGFFRFE
jgi:hypothetical protein